MQLARLIEELMMTGVINEHLNDIRANFAVDGQTFLGATLMPLVDGPNIVEVGGVESIVPIAKDDTDFAPVPYRPEIMRGERRLVELGSNSIGKQFTADDHQRMNAFLMANQTMQAQLAVLSMARKYLLVPLNQNIEKQRWDAIQYAQVTRQGDGDYAETVSFTNPTGHRVDAGQGFYDAATDPLVTIDAVVSKMEAAGYRPTRAYCRSRSLVKKLTDHPKIKERLGAGVVVLNSNDQSITNQDQSRYTLGQLNSILLAEFGFTIEFYDGHYYNAAGAMQFYLHKDILSIVSTDTVDPSLIEGEGSILAPTRLGYVGNGAPVGYTTPGRRTWLKVVNEGEKNPHVSAGSTQKTLAILSNPEAVGAITIPDQT